MAGRVITERGSRNTHNLFGTREMTALVGSSARPHLPTPYLHKLSSVLSFRSCFGTTVRNNYPALGRFIYIQTG